MHKDEPAPLTERFNLMSFTDELISDLKLLRDGKISVAEAHARANLAKQILKAIHYTIVAQKFMIEQAASASAAKKIEKKEKS